MARYLIADSHWGIDSQVVEAVANLGPRQRPKFDRAFPEWPRVLEIIASAAPLTGYYPEDGDPDIEYLSWVADWIETNTRMYWEDGDLWGVK